jgi:hypothetical protein
MKPNQRSESIVEVLDLINKIISSNENDININSKNLHLMKSFEIHHTDADLTTNYLLVSQISQIDFERLMKDNQYDIIYMNTNSVQTLLFGIHLDKSLENILCKTLRKEEIVDDNELNLLGSNNTDLLDKTSHTTKSFSIKLLILLETFDKQINFVLNNLNYYAQYLKITDEKSFILPLCDNHNIRIIINEFGSSYEFYHRGQKVVNKCLLITDHIISMDTMNENESLCIYINHDEKMKPTELFIISKNNKHLVYLPLGESRTKNIY